MGFRILLIIFSVATLADVLLYGEHLILCNVVTPSAAVPAGTNGALFNCLRGKVVALVNDDNPMRVSMTVLMAIMAVQIVSEVVQVGCVVILASKTYLIKAGLWCELVHLFRVAVPLLIVRVALLVVAVVLKQYVFFGRTQTDYYTDFLRLASEPVPQSPDSSAPQELVGRVFGLSCSSFQLEVAQALVEYSTLVPRGQQLWDRAPYVVVVVLEMLAVIVYYIGIFYIWGFLSEKTLYPPYHLPMSAQLGAGGRGGTVPPGAATATGGGGGSGGASWGGGGSGRRRRDSSAHGSDMGSNSGLRNRRATTGAGLFSSGVASLNSHDLDSALLRSRGSLAEPRDSLSLAAHGSAPSSSGGNSAAAAAFVRALANYSLPQAMQTPPQDGATAGSTGAGNSPFTPLSTTAAGGGAAATPPAQPQPSAAPVSRGGGAGDDTASADGPFANLPQLPSRPRDKPNRVVIDSRPIPMKEGAGRKPFTYAPPQTTEHAVSALKRGGQS